MTPLTESQERMLEAIRSFIASHGYPPTRRELTQLTGISSTNGVHDAIKILAKKGRVSYQPHLPRTLVVVGDPDIGAPGSWAWPRGDRRAAFVVLLGAAIRLLGTRRRGHFETVVGLAERPSSLEAYLPATLARRLLLACGPSPDVAEVSGSDLSFAMVKLREERALEVDEESDRWGPGPRLTALIGAPQWAMGRAGFAAWAIDNIPSLPVVRHAA